MEQMNPVRASMQYFRERFACAPSILAAFGEAEGLPKETAFKIACGLAAGCARTGQTCGAVTGAYLVLGLKYGKAVVGDDEAKEHTFSLVREFNERFLKQYPSINCTELLGVDMGTAEGLRKAREEKIIENICPYIVKFTAEILYDIIKEESGGDDDGTN